MKKILIVLVVSMFFIQSGFASTGEVLDGMKQKAIRGAVNLVTGIVEFPVQIYKGYNNGFEPIESSFWSKIAGTVLGIFRGCSHAAGRISWGGLELFGFWSASPIDNEGVGIPFDAEYAWEEGDQYSIFEPNLKEGLMPIGRKLVRGIGNSVVAIAEVPCQTVEGGFQGSSLKGFGKGLWFWLSRQVYGFGEVVTCIVPNPQDNPGYLLNGQWPWSILNEDINE